MMGLPVSGKYPTLTNHNYSPNKKTLLVVINIFLLIKHPTCITEPEVRNPGFPNA